MAMYVNPNWASGRQLVQCPYNPAHQFKFADVDKHLEDCRAEWLRARRANNVYDPIGKQICKYDNSHILNAVEIPLHEEMCAIRQQEKRLAAIAAEARPFQIYPVTHTPGTSAETETAAAVCPLCGNNRRDVPTLDRQFRFCEDSDSLD